jgi:antitoxin ParD1/3/4
MPAYFNTVCALKIDRLCQSLRRAHMNLSLTPELEKLVQAKAASGLYNNASEVIREALRAALRQESENDWLRIQAAIGYAQLEAGEAIPVSSKKAFAALVRGER